MKIGRTGHLPRARTPALGALVLALVLASTAAAGTGRNAIFNLGVVNSVSGYVTTLTGALAGRMLQVTNTSTATSAGAVGATNKSTSASTIRAQNTGGGPALEAVVPTGKSPMRVSAGAAKVANLNADRLDGLDSTQLQRRVGGVCAAGSSIRAISATGVVTCETKATSAGHADTADSATSATTATNAANAANADTLDGKDSADFYAAGSTVVDSAHADSANSATVATNASNADRLDGKDATAFMLGGGEVKRGARAFAAGHPGWGAFLTTPNTASTPAIGGMTIGYLCPSDLTQNGVIVIRNDSGEAVNVFLDDGSANPHYTQLGANGGRWDRQAAATGEHFTIQVQGVHVTTIEAFTVHRTGSNDCHTQGMATVSR